MKNLMPIMFLSAIMIITTSCQKEDYTANSGTNQNTISLRKVDVGFANSNVSNQPLIAGQSINVGTVSYNDIDTDNDGNKDALEITYNTTNSWELVEVHFFIGNSLSEMPTTKSGNPQIGLFPYTSGNISGQTSYSITIPFATLGFNCPGPEDYYVAAHASVRKPTGTGTYQTETGWGNGQKLVQKGNWAMFNTIFITCDVQLPPVLQGSSETAFAFDGDLSGCFQNYPAYLDNPMRWGWTNGPYAVGNYTWPIYAGAGLCDITKGTLVGTLNVNYNGSAAVVTYNITGTNPITGIPYTLKEVHLYLGNNEFPTKNGEYTISPGQYPNKATNLDTQSYSFTVNNLSGNIYVIAHAVVFGFPL